MIHMVNVHKTYHHGPTALTDINLKVDKGDFAYLTGPNGAGKTTILKLIFHAETPTRGEIHIDGTNIAKIKKSNVPYLRRKLGVIFQDFHLLKNRTVFQNVALALEIRGERSKQIQRKVSDVLRLVDLDGKSGAYPVELSGGERQRVTIARAMVNNPLILLADEPTGNLDPEAEADIMGLLNKINLRGTTIFLTTHKPGLIPEDHEAVFSLKDGRMTERVTL